MKKFEHILITRFNVKALFKKDKNGIPTDTQEWLDSRFKLFDKFCFPSIKNQKNKNFRWVVLFDKNTPQKHKEKIHKYQNEMKNFIPIYVGAKNKNSFCQDITHLIDKDIKYCSFMQDITHLIDKDIKYLITTRIDNDDSFCEDAIDTIQKNFIEKDLYFINLLKGHIYNINTKRLYLHEWESNPFISMVEKNTNHFKGVYCAPHNKLNKVGPIINIKGKAYWIVGIHERNVSNKRKVKDSKKFNLKVFNLNITKKFNWKEDIKSRPD